MKPFCSLFVHFLLIFTLPFSAVFFAGHSAAEEKIYDEEWRLQYRIDYGKIYDRQYRRRDRIDNMPQRLYK